jgi:D-glycero-alpha-D-manno-heptose-7-phosphate kinase
MLTNMKKLPRIVRARAPLRLGLAGGGTDVSPYCDQFGGLVLNVTIDRYAYAVITRLDGPCVRFIASDQERADELLLDNLDSAQTTMILHKTVYTRMMHDYHNNELIPLELSTFCDAPAGSGLGSSSTLVVAMIRAFVEFLNLPLDDYEIARLAYQIERIDCGLQGGRQDQYSATFGGFNFMEFYANDRVIINSLRIKNWIVCELEASLILFFTGISRESANIIADQSEQVKSGKFDAIDAMHGVKQEANSMKESILRGDFKGVVESMREGWKNKKRSAKTVSNSYLDEIYNQAIQAGALAGKVSGAGGGGFMLFFVSTEKRMNVIRTLNQFKGQLSNCHFTKHGAQAWRLYENDR